MYLFHFTANNTTAADNNNRDDNDDTDTEKTIDDIDEDSNSNKKAFERHKFPRDSGCFASSSSPASDRSSQPSQSESGIQPDDEEEEDDEDDSDDAVTKRPPQQSAQTRSLRDRHTATCMNDLEKLNISKDNFDVLVEKYVTEKTPLQVTPGRVSSTRSIFESWSH